MFLRQAKWLLPTAGVAAIGFFAKKAMKPADPHEETKARLRKIHEDFLKLNQERPMIGRPAPHYQPAPVRRDNYRSY